MLFFYFCSSCCKFRSTFSGLKLGEFSPVLQINWELSTSNAQALYSSPTLTLVFGNVETYSTSGMPPYFIEFLYVCISSNNLDFVSPFTLTTVIMSPVFRFIPSTVIITLNTSCFFFTCSVVDCPWTSGLILSANNNITTGNNLLPKKINANNLGYCLFSLYAILIFRYPHPHFHH